MARVAIIGGSGFYQMQGLQIVEEELAIDTPFGELQERPRRGKLEGHEVLFLARHGEGHRLSPSEINFRANIYALKMLGVEQIISVSAVGSMKEVLAPRHFVVPDQLVDNTKHRADTFFGDGIVAHVSMAQPFCARLGNQLQRAAEVCETQVHRGGTYLCMEGPGFSSQAESVLYRQLGIDIIGMTVATEAKLAREAEMCYALLACVTDYDCWHPDHDKVTTEAVMSCLQDNTATAHRVVREVLPKVIADERVCACGTALQNAIATDPRHITTDARQRLRAILPAD